MNTVRTHIIKAILPLLVLLTLTACGSTRYNGKVIPGNVGRPIIVENNDDRLNDHPGLEGLTVTLYKETRPGQPPAQMSRTITDNEGMFSFSIPSADTPRGTVTIRVTGDGIYSARSKTFLPRDGQTMLFTVVTRDPAVTPSSPDPTK